MPTSGKKLRQSRGEGQLNVGLKRIYRISEYTRSMFDLFPFGKTSNYMIILQPYCYANTVVMLSSYYGTRLTMLKKSYRVENDGIQRVKQTQHNDSY